MSHAWYSLHQLQGIMDLKAIFEIKLMLGGLEASRVALAEMLLYAYYVLNGHSDYQMNAWPAFVV